MTNLLRTGLFQALKEKVLWVEIILLFILGLALPFYVQYSAVKNDIVPETPNIIGQCAVIIGFAGAVFSSFFTGREYSDGILRNKITAGYKRIEIYVSDWLISSAANLVLAFSFILPYRLLSSVLLNPSGMPVKTELYLLLALVMLIVCLSACFTFISLTIMNKSLSSVLNLLLIVAFLAGGFLINKKMNEPQYIQTLEMSSEGQVYRETENPNYLDESQRKSMQIVYDVFPGGQIVQLASMDVQNLYRLPVYSSILSVVLSAAGIIIFDRKELK